MNRKFCNVLTGISLVTCLSANAKGNPGSEYSFDNLPKVAAPSFKNDTFNIIKYGAKEGGKALNTKSINDAITACSSKGGGVVFVPAGTWLTGPIALKSNVNLFLDHSAVLLFTKDFSQYSLINTNWEGVPAARNESPVSGNDLQNVAITGFGTIDGNGDAWRILKQNKVSESEWRDRVASGGVVSNDGKTWYPSESSKEGSETKEPGVLKDGKTKNDFTSIKDFLRPNLVVLINCKKVLLQGVVFKNSPAWTIHPLMCEDLTVRGIEVNNPAYAQNGDGIDVESCKNVLLENSFFAAGDDGICVKSGKDELGRKRNMPTENMIVRNCTVTHAHGGFVIGSEMSGGARNIFVYDCSFIGSDIGLRFKTKRGRGGIVENIHVRNIKMKNIVKAAIFFDMYYEAKDPKDVSSDNSWGTKKAQVAVDEGTPKFRNFFINDVTCAGADEAIFVRGLPEMAIENINLENITISADKGIEITDARNISLKNINVTASQPSPVVKIFNAAAITFNNINCNNTTPGLFAVYGDKSKDISIINSPSVKNGDAVSFHNGASESSVIFK